MTRVAKIVKEKKRQAKVKNNAVRRQELKDMVRDINNPNFKYDDIVAAQRKLQQQARNASKSRLRNRCRDCGRPRGVYRKFGLCRIHLREAMMRGDVTGLVLASW